MVIWFKVDIFDDFTTRFETEKSEVIFAPVFDLVHGFICGTDFIGVVDFCKTLAHVEVFLGFLYWPGESPVSRFNSLRKNDTYM